GDLWPGRGDLAGMIENEAGALPAQVQGVEAADALTFFRGDFALHAEDDAAISQGFGQVADLGDDFGAPDAEVVNGGLGFGAGRGRAHADDDSGVGRVTGVEDALEFLPGFEEAIGFIDHEGGFEFLDDMEERRGTDTGGNDRPVD